MQAQTIIAAIHGQDNQVVLIQSRKPIPVIVRRTVSCRSGNGTSSFNRIPRCDLIRLTDNGIELFDFYS